MSTDQFTPGDATENVRKAVRREALEGRGAVYGRGDEPVHDTDEQARGCQCGTGVGPGPREISPAVMRVYGSNGRVPVCSQCSDYSTDAHAIKQAVSKGPGIGVVPR